MSVSRPCGEGLCGAKSEPCSSFQAHKARGVDKFGAVSQLCCVRSWTFLSRRLFDREGHREVMIHGMGASITKAIYVAQDVLMHYGERLSLETHHGTVDVVDDVMGEYESTVEQRRVSSLTLHLRLTESEAGVAGVASRTRTSSLMNLISKLDWGDQNIGM